MMMSRIKAEAMSVMVLRRKRCFMAQIWTVVDAFLPVIGRLPIQPSQVAWGFLGSRRLHSPGAPSRQLDRYRLPRHSPPQPRLAPAGSVVAVPARRRRPSVRAVPPPASASWGACACAVGPPPRAFPLRAPPTTAAPQHVSSTGTVHGFRGLPCRTGAAGVVGGWRPRGGPTGSAAAPSGDATAISCASSVPSSSARYPAPPLHPSPPPPAPACARGHGPSSQHVHESHHCTSHFAPGPL